MFKKILAVLLIAAMLLLPMTGCVKDETPVVTIKGVSFTPGQYLMYQFDSYQTIANRMSYTFSGKTVKQQMKLYDSEEAIRIDVWISTNTLEELRLNVYFKEQFDALGLTISEEEAQTNHENAVTLYNSYETNYEGYYSKNGINVDSLEFWLTDQYRRTEVFNTLYGKGGANQVPDEEVKAFMSDRYGRAKFLAMPFFNTATGTLLSDEEIADIEDIVADVSDRINAGENIDDLNRESLLALGQIAEGETPDPVDDIFFDTEDSDFPTEMINIFKDTPYNTAAWYKDLYSGYYYIFLKLDPMEEGTEYFDTYYMTAVNAMKQTEYLEGIMEITGDFNIELNEASVKRYKPDKIYAEVTTAA